ncbi:hypothetical protein ACUSIJ_12715 [Pseudochelatococcus sp. B33]
MSESISAVRISPPQGSFGAYASSETSVPDHESKLKLFQTVANDVAGKGYAFAALADASAGVVEGNLMARTSGNWLADLFGRIVSWIRDGQANKKIRDDLRWTLGQHVQQCISDTRESLHDLTAKAAPDSEHRPDGAAPEIAHEPSAQKVAASDSTQHEQPITTAVAKLRQNLKKMENIHKNLHVIVDPGTSRPLDMREVNKIACEILTLSETSRNLKRSAFNASLSVFFVACGLPPLGQEVPA